MKGLGSRSASGVASADNPVFSGGYVVTFSPDILSVKMQCECYHIAIRGPSPSYFEMWVESRFYSIGARGDKNDWDPNNALIIDPGQTIYFYFSTGTGLVPTVVMYLREISAL